MSRSRITMILLVASLGCSNGSQTDNSSGANSETPPPSQEALLEGIVTAKPADTPESLAAKKALLEENLKRAEAASANRDFEQAVKLLEDAVMLEAGNRNVLFQLVVASRDLSKVVGSSDPARSYRLAYQSGSYLRTLQESNPQFSEVEQAVIADVQFDIACAHARANRHEEFSGTLSSAVGSGFDDAARIRSEPDLEPLRKYPEMEKLLNTTAQEVTSRAKERARKVLADFKPVDYSLEKFRDLPAAASAQDSLAGGGQVHIVVSAADELARLKSRSLGEKVSVAQVELDRSSIQSVPGGLTLPAVLIFDQRGRLRWSASGPQRIALVEAIAGVLLSESP